MIVDSASNFLLFGKGTDPDSDQISYQWIQLHSQFPALSLTDTNIETPLFTAPSITQQFQLTFRLIVTDSHGLKSKPDSVNIVVKLSKDYYIKKALAEIGLNPNTDLSKLTKVEWRTLNAAITARYAELYLQNPAAFKWAGMAAYASALVGNGMTLGNAANKIFNDNGDDFFKTLTDGNLGVYKDIAWQHEAYIAEGITALERFYQEGTIDKLVFKSWKQIDEGIQSQNHELVWQGNNGLLNYEQNVFLQNSVYDPHRAMWQLISTHPMIPTFSPIPGDSITFYKYITKNYPNLTPDIGDAIQRWDWITNSMLPFYIQLETQTPIKVNSDMTKYVKQYDKIWKSPITP